MAGRSKIRSNEDSEPGNGFTHATDSNPDLFLAASLQFLHRLLAKRTLQCVQVDDNGNPTSGLQVKDAKEENNTAEQLYSKQIDQIEEYKRQLRSMENFLSTIQFDAEKPAAHSKEDCEEMVDKTDCNVDSTDSLCASTSLYSYVKDDEFQNGIPERVKINVSEMKGSNAKNSTARRTMPGAAGDFSGRLPTLPVVVDNERVKSTASYASVVRNAVSGLARNYEKRNKSWRKNRPAKRWLLQPGITKNPEEVKRETRSEREVQTQYDFGKDADSPKEVPLRIQLAMEPGASPREPVTLLVRVPSTIFDLLNRKIPKRDTKVLSSDPSAESHIERGKRKRQLTSVFRNLLKGRTSPSLTSFYYGKEKPWGGAVTLAEETDGDAKTQEDDTSRNTLIYTLQRSASSDSIGLQTQADDELFCESDNDSVAYSRRADPRQLRRGFAALGGKSVNKNKKPASNSSPRVISCETKPRNGKSAGSTRRQLVDDKVLPAEMMPNETEVVGGSAVNYLDEKMIPLRYSKASPELNPKRGGISQRDVDTFLKLAARVRKNQVSRDVDSKHVEIPVEIKTTATPLRLHKVRNVSDSPSGGRIFNLETEGLQATSNRIEKEQFLHMLIGTLPDGPCVQQSTVNRDVQELETKKNRLEDHFQHVKKNEDSALEVLLRHIATGNTTCCAAEQKTTIQTAPKRQLSKISICSFSSSESLSGSDREDEMKDSRVSEGEYRVNHVVIRNKLEKPVNEKCHPSHGGPDKNDTLCYVGDRSAAANSEGKYAAGGKIRCFIPHQNATETESLNLDSKKKLITCDRTEVIIEEENASVGNSRAMVDLAADGDRTCLSIRETEKTIFCHPVISKQVFGQQNALTDAMIRWWGPQINYSTTPSSQTQLSTYSVSINNLM